MIIFFNLQIPSFYYKENLLKRKFEIQKNVLNKIVTVGLDKMIFDLEKEKSKLFEFLLIFSRLQKREV